MTTLIIQRILSFIMLRNTLWVKGLTERARRRRVWMKRVVPIEETFSEALWLTATLNRDQVQSVNCWINQEEEGSLAAVVLTMILLVDLVELRDIFSRDS
jgi:hypothetical protein